MGFGAPWHVDSFHTRDSTHVPCIGRQILNHCTTREVLKRLLMKVKEGNEKASLKLNIQKTNIMASSLIISWQIDGEKVETVTEFLFLGSKITADVDCSHEIKAACSLEGKLMTNLDSTLKSRDITLLTKVCLVKAIVFLVIMYRCERPYIRLSTEELLFSSCGAGENS
uniref:Uncharacterized protein n=1 Tax=Ovis aries TaxID=9940 RepID=A0AC11EHY2_SHEEP